MYNIALLLELAVVVSVPIMLCTKPMMFLMGSKRQMMDEQGHIELVDIKDDQACAHNKVAEQYQEQIDDLDLQIQPSQRERMEKQQEQ